MKDFQPDASRYSPRKQAPHHQQVMLGILRKKQNV